MIVNEKELKKKREWFERSYSLIKDALGNDTLVAIVYNIMDIEDVY